MKEKVIVSWSGGKDSAFALYEIRKNKKYEIAALLTTVTKCYNRISMHGVRRILLKRQARSLRLPIEEIAISKKSSNREYQAKMKEALVKYQNKGITSVVFGDIFLEDLRKYREKNLSKLKMKGIFPIWKRNTAKLANTFIDLGFKAVITCIDSKVLDKEFVGRDFNKQFLSELPPEIDPCGENGEFHSFVYDGPIFRRKISHAEGKIVLRNKRFYYFDVLPVSKKSKL